MRDNWPRAVSLLLVSEGSELNVGGSEPGGASRYGVSVAALSDLHGRLGLPPVTVKTIENLVEAQAGDFYQQVTARACRFDDLSVGVDYAMLDITANLGPSGGAWLLQNVLGQWPLNSTISDATVLAASLVDPKILVYALGAAWMAKKRESSGWSKSGHGWTNRMVRVRGDALAMTGEKA